MPLEDLLMDSPIKSELGCSQSVCSEFHRLVAIQQLYSPILDTFSVLAHVLQYMPLVHEGLTPPVQNTTARGISPSSIALLSAVMMSPVRNFTW